MSSTLPTPTLPTPTLPTSLLPDRDLVAFPGDDGTACTAPLRVGPARRGRTVPDGSVTASRARIADASDDDRRRVQHDLHHGAQQRLVHAVMALRLARDAAAAGRAPLDLIDEALEQAERASDELRDVVRGVLPTILVHGGLRPGVESVAADLGLAALLRVTARRLPPRTETTAFLVVAEALRNVARHACACRVDVRVALDGDVVVVEVRDDGVGGADPARGRGLTGMVDRVEAAGGWVRITSPAGAGTVVRATLPVEVA